MPETGGLWARVRRRHAQALASGALHRLPTEVQRIEDQGVRFVVRSLAPRDSPVRMPETWQESTRAGAVNPFLPYEAALHVADLAPHHVCLFNKFSVVEHHLLLVTRAFEHQESLLGAGDFAALAHCLRELDALGFYNAGQVAGASQPHRHLQVVPLPLAPGVEGLPIAPLLQGLDLHAQPLQLRGFAFRHALQGIEARALDPADAGVALHAQYRRLLRATGIGERDGLQSLPYNLLLTRGWMLLVPRSREHFAGMSVNGLGFAGSLFVRGTEDLAALRAHGPLRALRAVAQPA